MKNNLTVNIVIIAILLLFVVVIVMMILNLRIGKDAKIFMLKELNIFLLIVTKKGKFCGRKKGGLDE